MIVGFVRPVVSLLSLKVRPWFVREIGLRKTYRLVVEGQTVLTEESSQGTLGPGKSVEGSRIFGPDRSMVVVCIRKVSSRYVSPRVV